MTRLEDSTIIAMLYERSELAIAELDRKYGAVIKTLLKDVNEITGENYYLTVFFDGDRDGAPMYAQLQQYAGYVTLTVGTGHSVG